MADAGEIKARVTIEYDGSGIQQAKEDLASLAEAAGSFGGDGGIGDAISAMSDGFAEGTKGAEGFANAVEGIAEPLKSGEEAVSNLNDAFDEHQQVIEDTGAAYEALQEPMGTSIALLGETSPAMQQVAQHAQELSRQIIPVNEGFAQIGESLSQAVPMLPQFSDSLHEVSAAFDPKAFGLDTFAENMAVFQDALSNPTPFSMIQSHLNETGQTWDDFTSSIGGDNTAALHDMAQNASVAGESINSLNASAQETGKTFSGSREETQAFTEQFNALGGAAQDTSKAVEDAGGTISDTFSAMGINKFGGVGSEQYGPLSFVNSLAKESGGLGDILGGALSDVGNAFMGISNMVMPLMAFQMVGMAVQQVGQGIYNAAAIAEGPAAHSMGTFTGTVDALTQSAQQSGQAFSESFGQNILPTLNAINYQMNQGGGAGGIGGMIGSAASYLSNIGLLAGGLTTIGINPLANQMIQTGGEGLINQVAQAFGFQQPFQGPGPQAQAQINYQQQFAQLSQTVGASATNLQLQGDTAIQEGLDPNYLAQQHYAAVGQQFLQRQQASYDVSHPLSPQQAAINYSNAQHTTADEQAYQQYLNSGGTPITPDNPYGTGGGGGFLSGLGGLFSGGGGGFMDFAKNLTGIGQGIGNFFGLNQNPSSFIGGNISAAGPVGVMSNSGIGSEAVQLTHTFTAEVTWEANNLSKQFTAVAQWAEQGLQRAVTAVANWTEQGVNKAITAVANWTEQNVIKPIIAVANWTEQNVSHAVTAVANWVEQNVSHAVTAVANWVDQNVSHAVTAMAEWTEQNLVKPVVAAAEWTTQNLEKSFTAAATWAGKNLENDFLGVATWAGQNLEHQFVATATWVGQGLNQMFSAPSFAEGVSGFSGGAAIVGEAGMEVIEHNGAYSLVDSPTFMNLPAGASVYPMQELSSSASPRMYAQGTGDSITPIMLPILGGGGNSGPVTIQLHVGGQMLAEQTFPYIAPLMRAQFGIRR